MVKGFELGVLTKLKEHEDSFAHVAQFGLNVCQLCNWDENLWTEKLAQKVKHHAAKACVRISALWAGYPGPCVWDFVDGPSTLGLVPSKYRKMRIRSLKKAADFAKNIKAPAIVTHAGFIPENPKDPDYKPTVTAIRNVASYCLKKGIGFWFETGQETPVTLLRTIEDIGLPNLGINFDTANVVLYGKANPVDSLDVYGNHVRSLHAKDGRYPTHGRNLGKEVAIGKGKANFPVLLKKLKSLGFRGDVIIEREISGQQQKKDIRKAVQYLKRIISRL